MNRKLLLGAAFFFAGINVSSASDLDLPVTYDSDWSGLYGTLSGGYANIDLEGQDFGVVSGNDEDSSGGAVFGIGTGYNFDLGDVVLGLEADIGLLTNESTLEMKNTVDADYDWFATGRLRAGYDFDGTMLYGTGGVALLNAHFDDALGASDDKTFVGWTVGGGIEHMIGESLSLRLEGLYADFPEEDLDLALPTEVEPGMWLVRAGVSLYF